jgi:hypothetical protein
MALNAVWNGRRNRFRYLPDRRTKWHADASVAVQTVANMRRLQFRRFVAAFAVLLMLAGGSTLANGSPSRSHHSSSTTHPSGSSEKVYVHGYFRKDGTYVAPHYATAHAPTSTVTPTAPQRDEHGRFKRSEAAKDAFKREHPCPSTGKTSGACPGYVIDHITALKHGGADAPSNMQWQTTEAAKEKDKWE